MSHISVRVSRSFISYPNSSLDKRNEAASSFKILSSSALPGKSGITSICGAVMIGAIYFVQSCFPVPRQVGKHRKYEVAVYSFFLRYCFCHMEYIGIYYAAASSRKQQFSSRRIIFNATTFHIKKVPLSCASATVHNVRYTCQVLPLKRYRENLFQNREAVLPCFQYKIQCYGYFSCLFTCTSAILYLLYGLNILE